MNFVSLGIDFIVIGYEVYDDTKRMIKKRNHHTIN